MKKRQIIVLALCAVMLLSCCACGTTPASSTGKPATSNDANSSTGLTETPEPVKNDEGVEVYFDGINEDIISVSQIDWYRGPITVYESSNTNGMTKKTPADTLVYGITSNIQGAYPPHNQQENLWSFNVYESLLRRNYVTNELEPWLATEYSFDDAGNLHLTLREGVKFHDGNEMTAEDVMYTLLLSHDDPKARAYQQMQKIDFDASTIEDDYHLTLAFKENMGSILDLLASGYLHIMSKDFVEKVGPDYAYLEADAGTGAYYIVESVTDQSQTFHSFKDYWGGCPEIDNIVVKRYTDTTVLAIDFLNGELDLTMRFPYEDCLSVLDGTYSDVTFYRIPNNRYKQVFFNTISEKSPMADINVRKAFAYCMNYDEMVYAIYDSYAMGGDQMTSIFMPGISYKADIGKYEYNPELAKQCLAEAGYSESNPCVIKLITSTSNNNDRVAEMMQAYCAEVGIDLQLDIVKASALKDQKDGLMAESEYDILINTGDYANGSPTGALAGWDVYGMEPGSYNPMKATNSQEFHDLYAKAELTADEAERTEAYKQLQQLFFDNVWYLPILPDAMPVAAHPWVQGTTFSSGYTTVWANWSIAK